MVIKMQGENKKNNSVKSLRLTSASLDCENVSS